MKLKVIILYLVKETIVYVFWVYSGLTHSEFVNPITDMKKDGIAKRLRILHGNGIEFLL